MDVRWVAAGGGAASGLALLCVWWRTRREVSRLRERLETASMELQRLQIAFARFTPQEVIERIIASGVATSADKKEVTVLFADLVGFTRISERLDPAVLVQILNGHFARMSRVITEHRGHVSKFIGDGMLALFGALDANPWQANDAVHAGLAMRAALGEYNRELEAAGLPTLRMGIGLHRGVAVAGVVGSHELMEFTVIGNTVNLAARVERLTRVHQTDMLVTRAVKETLDPRFVLRELPAVPIRGISDPVVTFAVERFEPGASDGTR
jgi:adenylate cyclase